MCVLFIGSKASVLGLTSWQTLQPILQSSRHETCNLVLGAAQSCYLGDLHFDALKQPRSTI